MNLYPETLPAKTAKLADKLQNSSPEFLNQFYLSGGTGLSLQLGHRESLDLDFFTEKNFKPGAVQTQLEKIGQLENAEADKRTFNCFIDGVAVQFLYYPYPNIKPFVNWENIKISSVLDIGCTKIHTIGSRGSKKDFIDLYFVLQQYSLKKIFRELKNKYQQTNYNKIHLLKALVYFKTAEKQPMPKMHQQISWLEVKKTLRKKSQEFFQVELSH
jgi:hypothetical protein